MNDLTTAELEQMTLNLGGFKHPLIVSVVDKIGAELARREGKDVELDRLNKVAALLAS